MKEGSKHTEETKAKIAESMLDNLNAEKWTEEALLDLLPKMIAKAKEVEEIEVSLSSESGISGDKETEKDTRKSTTRKLHLKIDLLIEFEIWNKHWFSEMAKKFADNKTVSNLLGAIDMLCEANTYNDAANGATSSTMAKMNLSTHYNWEDKTKNDNTTKLTVDRFQFEMPEATPETQKKWEEAQNKEE